MTDALLAVRGLHAHYGKSHVLRGVGLQVGVGEIVSLLGRNGAGRSTLLKAAVGQVEASGSICFKGKELLGLKPFQIARLGLGYVPESRDVFPGLTVEQNLVLGIKGRGFGLDGKWGRWAGFLRVGRPARHPDSRSDNRLSAPGADAGPGAAAGLPRWELDDMYRLFPRLLERRGVLAGSLSGGEQQMLTLCRCLMGNPELVLIDEPTEGLAPKIVAQVAAFLLELKSRGVSVLLVEQKLAIALEISSRVLVLGHGVAVFEGTPAELRANPAVSREWLGV